MYLTNRARLHYAADVRETIIFKLLAYILLSLPVFERVKTKMFIPKDKAPIFHLSYNPDDESLYIWEVKQHDCERSVDPSFFSETINLRTLNSSNYNLAELIIDRLLKLQERIEKFCGKEFSDRFMDKLCDHTKQKSDLELCLKTN